MAIASKPARLVMLGHNYSMVINSEGKIILNEILTRNLDINIQTPASFCLKRMMKCRLNWDMVHHREHNPKHHQSIVEVR